VLIEAFRALYSIDKPEEIIDIPFKWKKQKYNESTKETLKMQS